MRWNDRRRAELMDFQTEKAPSLLASVEMEPPAAHAQDVEAKMVVYQRVVLLSYLG